MVVKKSKKISKKESEEEDSGGMGLDDAFGDDEDVEYAESKPRVIKKKDEDFEEYDNSSSNSNDDSDIEIKSSKPISKLKKGDSIKVDGKNFEVDAHYVLIDHGTTNEMAIEFFDKKEDKDYQIRYFDDNVNNSIEVYQLDEIVYNKINVKKIEW